MVRVVVELVARILIEIHDLRMEMPPITSVGTVYSSSFLVTHCARILVVESAFPRGSFALNRISRTMLTSSKTCLRDVHSVYTIILRCVAGCHVESDGTIAGVFSGLLWLMVTY
jgi:hypothetical protein